MNNSSKDIKELKEQHDKETKDYQKAHNKNIKKDNLIADTDNKVSTIEYYNSLSDSEKLEFQEQIKKKKLRDNYISYLKYIYGENYTITRFHRFLANVCQSVVQRIENGEKVRIALSCPPQHGKGYPTDFPILTTKGWKKHGDLKIGDYVYNDNGEQVKVIGTQEHYKHSCLKITFANGEQQVITREHLWKVYFEHDKKVGNKHHRQFIPEIIETRQLMEILPKCRRSPYVLINKPLQNDNKELPIDPYVLGLWLGDGISRGREIVVDDKDLPYELNGIADRETYEIIKRGKNVSCIRLGNKLPNGRTDFVNKLKSLNLYGNKHIPTEYLLASEEQRWELLRGLMDTDGCCDKKGNCEFANINKELAYNVYTLLHSLGIKARVGEYNATLYGRYISKKYRVLFNPNNTDYIFKIRRKQERLTNKVRKDRQDKFKYFIKSIEEVDDEIVSCISVDGGMYLSGYELIPTHNSMTLTEALPSWFMGRNPDLRCIVTAYNADVAEKFGDKNRQLVKTFGKDIFGIEISDSQDNKTLWDLKKHMGGLYSTGLGGSLTSNNGALIIVDDPFKSELEANTQSIRDAVWSNFTSAVMTRQRGAGNGIIVIHTRWHEDDLIGRLKKLDDGEWIIINIPCIWEKGIDKMLGRKIGETLCPELGFDSKWAESMKKTIGLKQFNALYQGEPYTEGGELIKRSYIQTYDSKTRPSVFEELVLSCDLSFGGTKSNNDPVCLSVWGRLGGNHYLLECVNKKMTFTQTLDSIRVLCGKYPQMIKKIIERKANGSATIEVLNKEIGGFVAFDVGAKSKVERLELCLPYFEAGNIFFPDERLCPEIEELTQQLLRFPKSTHDDFVDTISQYLLNYQYKCSGGRVATDKSFATISKAIRGFRV